MQQQSVAPSLKLRLDLGLEEVAMIADSLGNLPHKVVRPLIDKINLQVAPQIQMYQAAQASAQATKPAEPGPSVPPAEAAAAPA